MGASSWTLPPTCPLAGCVLNNKLKGAALQGGGNQFQGVSRTWVQGISVSCCSLCADWCVYTLLLDCICVAGGAGPVDKVVSCYCFCCGCLNIMCSGPVLSDVVACPLSQLPLSCMFWRSPLHQPRYMEATQPCLAAGFGDNPVLPPGLLPSLYNHAKLYIPDRITHFFSACAAPALPRLP